MLVGKSMSQTVTFQANNHDNVFFYITFVWQHYILLKALGIKPYPPHQYCDLSTIYRGIIIFRMGP